MCERDFSLALDTFINGLFIFIIKIAYRRKIRPK